MKFIIGLKSTFTNIFFVSLTIIFMIWLSVFLYGLFYYMYIPAIAHTRPVYFQFDTSCQSGICNFPSANVILAKNGYSQLLSRGQPYQILLDLEMPESEVNRRLGMFMVKLSMVSQDGDILKSSFRSALLIYKSPMLRYIYTFFFSPFLLAGTSSEKQLLTISLFESYEEDADKPAYEAIIEVHSRVLEIYKATLRIHAHFTGLRYLMYYWPGLSATVGVCTNFYFLSMIALFSWYRFLKWHGKVENDNTLIGKASETPPSTPVPLNKQKECSTSNALQKTKSSQAFDLLKRLSSSPEKTSLTSKGQDTSISSPLRPHMLTRVLEVDSLPSSQLMSPIEEEDITPVSEEGFDILQDKLRKRK